MKYSKGGGGTCINHASINVKPKAGREGVQAKGEDFGIPEKVKHPLSPGNTIGQTK